MQKCYIAIDLKSFYASVELLDFPELRDSPVAVAGDPEGRHGIHHFLLVGVDDGQSQTGPHGLHQEILGDEGAVGQAEGDIGHAQNRLQTQLMAHGAHGF